jgi:hypothetical protein
METDKQATLRNLETQRNDTITELKNLEKDDPKRITTEERLDALIITTDLLRAQLDAETRIQQNNQNVIASAMRNCKMLLHQIVNPIIEECEYNQIQDSDSGGITFIVPMLSFDALM